VRLADRGFLRHHSRGWSRALTIELPVYCLYDWRRPDVKDGLMDCLDYLTGDRWNFHFVKRRRKAPAGGQVHLLSAPDVPRVFVPFSHGLDSFAQSSLLEARDSIEVVPVNINARRQVGSWRALGRRGRPRAVPVSSQVDEPRHPELSFRTRPFIFDMMAAYGAAISGARRVLVPENGQGSLGGSLVPLGNEAPHRSCHPGFTTRLERLVDALTGKQVRFEHPGLFTTKGQVLAELARVRPKAGEWLSTHSSCSYDARHAHQGGHKVHCGVCGNCLLRRLSVHAAGVEDPTQYLAANLGAETLAASFTNGKVPREFAAYSDIALNGARSMQRLADLAHTPDAPRVWAEIDGLAHYQARPILDVKKDMYSFLQQHHREWSAFLTHCGSTSWVGQLAGG
jgi:7-cyano-7-deazaguanine synthase in queuosine biosynthesis